MKLKTFGIGSLLMLLTLPFLQSCLDDDDKQSYSQLSIGTIQVIDNNEYYFALDAGGKMYPGDTTNINNYTPKSGQRTFIYFDLLEENIPGYDFNAIIYRIENILTKQVVRVPSEEKEEDLGDDRINITNMWIADDYLNIQYQLLYDDTSDKKHLLSLAVNEAGSYPEVDSNYLTLEFRHHAFKEKENRLGPGIVSFKLSRIQALMQGKKGLNIRYKSLYDGIRYKKVDFK